MMFHQDLIQFSDSDSDEPTCSSSLNASYKPSIWSSVTDDSIESQWEWPIGYEVKAKQQQQQNVTPSPRLHVSNIPFRYRREHLTHMFSIFGRVIDAEVIFNERGSKGFGFVSFTNVRDAKNAKIAFHGIIIDQRRIEVNYATPKPRKSSNHKSSFDSRAWTRTS